jgi:PAS domain S-box-containing protein
VTRPLRDARSRQVRRLTELSRALSYTVSADEVYELALNETAALLHADQVVLQVKDEDERLVLHSRPPWLGKQLEQELTSLDESAVAHLREQLARSAKQGFLAVPLVIEDKVSGVLAVTRSEDSAEHLDDEWVLSSVADQTAVALEKIHLNRAALLADKARREREEQFQSLYNSPLIGLVFKTTDGKVVDANDAFFALTGYSRDASHDLSWDTIVPRDKIRHPERPHPGRGSKVLPFEAELRRKDEHTLEVLIGSATLEEQDRELVFVIDISAQKRAEASIRLLSEASNALIGASLDHAALMKSLAFLVVPRFADWCAIELIESGAQISEHVAIEHLSSSRIAHAHQWHRRFPPHRDAEAGVARVIRTGQSQLHEEVSDSFLTEYACDGNHESELTREGLRSAILVPLVMEGRVGGVITFVRSKRRRRFGREDLVLAEEVGRRAAAALDNARLYRQANDAIGLRDEFLAVAAHELKTPLATLQLQLDTLTSALTSSGVNLERTRHRVDSARRQTERLTKLVEDLLDVSLITTRRLALERQDCDLVELVREVTGHFEGHAGRAGSPIELQLPEQPVVGCWDRSRIEQVLVNLVANAVKYGAGKPIYIAVIRRGHKAAMVVKDAGIGIASKDLARIFERFERAVSTRNYGGLGLGLFIAQQIVHAHGGEIDVRSLPGAGAEFVVSLPLHEDAECREGEASA